jgi:Carboxypeptidase regulatory-like domain
MRASVRWVVVLLSVFMSSFAVSQSTTSLRGVVTDAKGAVLPGATVTIHDSQTGFSRSVNSGDDGVYQFLQLPPATYGITVRAKGFGGLTRENVTLLVSSPATLNFTMQVEGATEKVEVTSRTGIGITRILLRALRWRIRRTSITVC